MAVEQRTRGGYSVDDATTPEAVGDAEGKISAPRPSQRDSQVLTRLRLALLDDGTSQQVAALADQIAKRQQALEASGGMAQDMENIRMHAGSATELQSGLSAFIAKFPADRRSADFKDAIARLASAKSLEAWHTLSGSFEGGLAAGTPAQTKKRLETVSAFLTAHPDCPLAAEISTYRDYLQRANDALADKGTWQAAFADLLATPVLSDLTYLQVS